MSSDLIPPDNLVRMVGSETFAHYKAVGEEFLKIFINYGGLQPTDRVLDVGCGSGRMAVPLTRYLTSGSYEGFDISQESIEWCRNSITAQFPNFRFQLANVHNSFYNPKGKYRAKDYKFPFPDQSFDFTFLTSVFTHMLPRDMEHYIWEIARVLKPGGKAVITFFILNEESERLRITPQSKVPFEHLFQDGAVRVGQLENPEGVVAYPEATVRQVLEQHRLVLIQPIYFGSWCGRKNTVTFQDLTISERKPGPLPLKPHGSILNWLWSRLLVGRA